MKTLLDERLASLLGLSPADLISLPRCATETVFNDGKDIKVTTYHEMIDEGRQRVVVQGIRQRWGGLTATVQAAGFEIAPDGVRRMMTQEELYDFT